MREENGILSELDSEYSIKVHLDELRKRLINCLIFFSIAFVCCYIASGFIISCLFYPVKQALPEGSTWSSQHLQRASWRISKWRFGQHSYSQPLF